ncbi:acetylcholinesterase [Polychaeton citri CBS 116435]|uniref:Carboxylic ester hydrolase n=1 Tax=Polychaeton citri CBS 116435 TaxID=1314669 RepID=A0A9P4Q2C7_9PEZI|nr:acetylcholinesterase [Polychaeton citri CBS 116435]
MAQVIKLPLSSPISFYLRQVMTMLSTSLVFPRNTELTVSTSSGLVSGKVDPSLPNTRQFLGIPFAHPPTGNLRWAPPLALSQPYVRISAKALPPSCMQYLTSQGNSLYVRDVLEFNLQGLNHTGTVSEDCLTLSIWTPTQHYGRGAYPKHGPHGGGLPVLIFFYGGGFSTGGEDVPYQIPAQWVERTKEHIVVSLNYRLNLFGFPNAAGLDEQNLGLSDQRLAVEWCEQNIAAFGGDPSRMVIWGQSAGSQAVSFYSFAYPDDPIVTGLIQDSGSAGPIRSNSDPCHTNFTFISESVGCEGLAGDPPAQLACMRAVDATTLENFFASYQESGQSPSISFGPVPDGRVVFQNYTQRGLEGKQAKIPAIIGTNAQDGVAFAPYKPDGPDPEVTLQQLLSHFFCASTETIFIRQQTNLITFRYLYSGNFSNIAPKSWMGAYHSSELPLIMGTHPNYRGPSTQLEYDTSHAMQDAWVAFAKNPEYGLANVGWQKYTQLGEAQVRDFGGGVAAEDTSLAVTESLCSNGHPI